MKGKIKFLWFNLFWCLTTGIACFIALSTFCKLPNLTSAIIAFAFYFVDVIHTTAEDYLEERIKKLEDKQ